MEEKKSLRHLDKFFNIHRRQILLYSKYMLLPRGALNQGCQSVKDSITPVKRAHNSLLRRDLLAVCPDN